MSAWTHSVCGRCWNERSPDRPLAPERDGAGALERCCLCGFAHASGIYLRMNPDSAELACRAPSKGVAPWAHEHDSDEDET